jgi:hypothetical protein
MSAERDQEFADLLSAVIERHAVASRLQGTAALADDVLSDAMRIGDGVRRALRSGTESRPSDGDCDALAELARRLEDATDAQLAEPIASALRHASGAGEMARAAALALDLFAGLARPTSVPERLYSSVTARRRARTGETLVHPAALADEIATRSREGLGPASGDGAAEATLPEPIALSPSFAGCGSEIALVRASADLADALLEDTASGDLLVFSRRLAGPFSIALAPEADDEWWAASSFGYIDYRQQLADALRAHGFAVAIVEE